MCLFCPSFIDYASSRRSNFDPRLVQKRWEINFRTRPKMFPRWFRGGPGMLVSYSQPESYCSSKNMLVCQDHDPLQRSSPSANIIILRKDHHPLPTL